MSRNETHQTEAMQAGARATFRTPLGLDARLPRERYLAREWTAERRELYLLRPDVERPVSVDRAVWPSLFLFPGDWTNPDRKDKPVAPQLAFGEVATRLWRDRARMDAALRMQVPPPHGALVRIDLVTDASDKAGDAWKILNFVPEPVLEGSADWPVAGYDVAAASLLSGLMNCGYSLPERRALRPVWAPKVNDHGLFESLDDALAYRAATDARVPEHAPFFVFAVALADAASAA
jgi:hypothetical protein